LDISRNVQKQDMEKSLGKTCFEKSLVTIMLSNLFLCEKSCYDNFFDSEFFGIFLKIHEDTQKMPKMPSLSFGFILHHIWFGLIILCYKF
jgi:hypothetical protein